MGRIEENRILPIRVSSMHNPRKSPFAEHAKDALLGGVIGVLFGSAACVIITLLVGSCAYVLTGASQETQAAAVFPTLSASALTCVTVGGILGARAGHYEGLGLSFTVIKGVLVGGSIAVIATLFTSITVCIIMGSAAGVLSGLWFNR